METKALVLVAQGADAALARELGRVVQPVEVRRAAGEEGVLQQADDGGL